MNGIRAASVDDDRVVLGEARDVSSGEAQRTAHGVERHENVAARASTTSAAIDESRHRHARSRCVVPRPGSLASLTSPLSPSPSPHDVEPDAPPGDLRDLRRRRDAALEEEPETSGRARSRGRLASVGSRPRATAARRTASTSMPRPSSLQTKAIRLPAPLDLERGSCPAAGLPARRRSASGSMPCATAFRTDVQERVAKRDEDVASRRSPPVASKTTAGRALRRVAGGALEDRKMRRSRAGGEVGRRASRTCASSRSTCSTPVVEVALDARQASRAAPRRATTRAARRRPAAASTSAVGDALASRARARRSSRGSPRAARGLGEPCEQRVHLVDSTRTLRERLRRGGAGSLRRRGCGPRRLERREARRDLVERREGARSTSSGGSGRGLADAARARPRWRARAPRSRGCRTTRAAPLSVCASRKQRGDVLGAPTRPSRARAPRWPSPSRSSRASTRKYL